MRRTHGDRRRRAVPWRLPAAPTWAPARRRPRCGTADSLGIAANAPTTAAAVARQPVVARLRRSVARRAGRPGRRRAIPNLRVARARLASARPGRRWSAPTAGPQVDGAVDLSGSCSRATASTRRRSAAHLQHRRGAAPISAGSSTSSAATAPRSRPRSARQRCRRPMPMRPACCSPPTWRAATCSGPTCSSGWWSRSARCEQRDAGAQAGPDRVVGRPRHRRRAAPERRAACPRRASRSRRSTSRSRWPGMRSTRWWPAPDATQR